jgi:hypothetical protein
MEYTSTLDLNEVNKVLSNNIRDISNPLQNLVASNHSINGTLSDGSTLYQITLPNDPQTAEQASVVPQPDPCILTIYNPEVMDTITEETISNHHVSTTRLVLLLL